jgi:hypothetical protein
MLDVSLAQLWLPILISGVVVFVLSFMMWMVFPHHRKDWSRLPDEDGFMDLVRSMGAKGGQYSFPHVAGPEDWKNPELIEKYNKGPKGFLTLKPDGPESMGKNMGISGAFNLVTALLVAYVATMALPAGESKAMVFRFVWTVAFLTNSFGVVWNPIWFGRSWSSTFKELFDGLVYGAATGVVFMFLWPGAAE